MSSKSSPTNPPSSSLSGFLSTLVPAAAIAAVYVGIFLIVRSRYKRVYRPRTYLDTLREDEKSQTLPNQKFGWFKSFWSVQDEYVLNHQSLDGYLYVRFFKMVTVLCFVGCFNWVVLFPVTATGHGGQEQLDLLSFSNLGKQDKNRYYAHVFCGWLYFTFVMYVITRETIYFINLRHAYLLAPFNAAKISSRTVVFTDVPTEYNTIEALQNLFGSAFRKAWLTTDCSDLEELVKERNKDAMKLEGAEIKLSKVANDKRLKAEKKAAKKNKGKEAPRSSQDEEAGLASSWLEKKDRPTHKLGKIPFIGKKVDTIEWSRDELKRLIPEVQKKQLTERKFEGKKLPTVFVEFNTQQAAQAAFRRMSPKKSPKLYPRAISVAPEMIVWKNLKITKTQRLIRKILTQTFITLMIIFWAIPVAVVGAISNINYLQEQLPFLSFINDIPQVILGVVTGLLPVVAIAILMALVPIVCRWMAKLRGEVTLAAVELKCQGWYMAFQVIQVFLVVTLGSGASSVVSSIIDDPSSATTLLATSLPKASNFYISYFILQGLAIASGAILNIGALVTLTLVAKFLDKSPRKIYKRYITLAGFGWGSLYPLFGNMAIIAITYSIIAPLVLGFATIGFFLIYLVVRYNGLFVQTNNIDTKGAAYAKVMQQLMTGVYLAEVCLIGLFAINTAPGPLVLMIVYLVGTAIYHAMMRHALKPLMDYLPDSYDADQATMFDTSDHKAYDSSKAAGVAPHEHQSTPKKFTARKASMFSRIWDPAKYKSHQSVTALVPNLSPPSYEESEQEDAYYNPAVTSPVPQLWIVRDAMGISKQEVRDSSSVVPITDEFASFNEKGKVVWTQLSEDGELSEGSLKDVPVWEKRVDY